MIKTKKNNCWTLFCRWFNVFLSPGGLCETSYSHQRSIHDQSSGDHIWSGKLFLLRFSILFWEQPKKLNQTKLCYNQNCILPWHHKSPSFLFRTSAPLQRHSLIIRIIRMIIRIIRMIIRIIRMIGMMMMRRRNTSCELASMIEWQ